MTKCLLPTLLVALATLSQGCGPSTPPPATDTHAGGSGHGHEHTPPHGGTPVVLGNEAFHVEFVRDGAAGKMTAYILDGHMDQFIRISAPSFTVEAAVGPTAQTLTFKAVSNPATGEKVGDSSHFEASADWLKTVEKCAMTLTSVEIRGTKFSDVKFRFPEGNESAPDKH